MAGGACCVDRYPRCGTVSTSKKIAPVPLPWDRSFLRTTVLWLSVGVTHGTGAQSGQLAIGRIPLLDLRLGRRSRCSTDRIAERALGGHASIALCSAFFGSTWLLVQDFPLTLFSWLVFIVA